MRAFISMGSNLEPERNLRKALRQLASAVRVLGVSTVFETEPIGRPDQASYYNCVAAIETSLAPLTLKEDVLRRIENHLGRKRGDDKYAARTIDLDLLLYGDLVMNEAGLEIPDPDILLRPFLAQGVAELAPDLILPGTGTSIAELVRRRMNGRALKPLEAYTVQLRGELNHGP